MDKKVLAKNTAERFGAEHYKNNEGNENFIILTNVLIFKVCSLF